MTETFLSLVVFLSTTIVYVYTCNPTVTGGDNGELITAAYVLGVAHPPGYPLWTMIAALQIRLLDFTRWDVAYRANLLSAFFGGIAALLVFQSLVTWLDESNVKSEDGQHSDGTTQQPPSRFRCLFYAFIGSLMFAFNPRVWHCSTHAEVRMIILAMFAALSPRCAFVISP